MNQMGSLSGTSIQDLHKKERDGQYESMRRMQQMQQMQQMQNSQQHMQQNMQNMMYGTMQNQQAEQGHNAAYTIQQAQHAPYFNIPNNYGYPAQSQVQYGGPTCPNEPEYPGVVADLEDHPDMEDLARDIANNLPSDSYKRGLEHMEGIPTLHGEETTITTKSHGIMWNVPKMLREPLIILVLYIILSLPAVYTFIGKYVKPINCDATGRVSFAGVVIYGIILATTYALTKKILLK